MKKALMVFSKIPKLGEVKTRLTEDRGGILTPEEAKNFYESCLLDVLDLCLSVEEVDFWLCYNQDGDRSYLDNLLTKLKKPQGITGIFPDQGGSFNDCMQYASDFILKPGQGKERLADGLMIIGGDLPTLQSAVLRNALAKMEKLSASEAGQKAADAEQMSVEGDRLGACIVEGACQEGGFSLIGITAVTPFNYQKVFYNMDGVTALDMLVDKAVAENIPFGFVEMLPDVDIPVDLAGIIPVLRAMEIAAKFDASVQLPQRTLAYLAEIGLQSMALPPERETV